MNIQRFFQILVNLTKKHPLDFIMRNRGGLFATVRMVGSVLHKAVHDMIARRAKGRVIDTRNSKIHKGSLTNPISFCLVV